MLSLHQSMYCMRIMKKTENSENDWRSTNRKRKREQCWEFLVLGNGEAFKEPELPTSSPRSNLTLCLLFLPSHTQEPEQQAQHFLQQPQGGQSEPQQKQQDIQQVLHMPWLLKAMGLQMSSSSCLQDVVNPADQTLGRCEGVGAPDGPGSHCCRLVPEGRHRENVLPMCCAYLRPYNTYKNVYIQT